MSNFKWSPGVGGEESTPLIDTGVTYQIPTDFATLQIAIDHISRGRATNANTITLNIETGHDLTDGLSVANGDFSHVVITSDDATVSLDASFAQEYVITGTRSQMPVLSCLIDVDSKSGVYWGYRAEFQSSGEITSGDGVINCDGSSGSNVGACLRVKHNSRVTASGAVFTGGAYRNVWVTRSSTLVADSADFSGCLGDFGLFVSRGSQVYANGSDISDCAEGAVRVARAFCQIEQNADLTGAGTDGITAFRGAIVSADSANISTTANPVGNHGVNVLEGGALVNVDGATIDDCGDRAISNIGGRISAIGTSVDGATNEGIYCEGGEVNFKGGFADGNGSQSQIRARYASMVNCAGATITGGANYNVSAEDGSTICVVNATCTGGSTGDLAVLRGGVIAANGCTTSAGSPAVADANVSSFNAIDSNNGIIYS